MKACMNSDPVTGERNSAVLNISCLFIQLNKKGGGALISGMRFVERAGKVKRKCSWKRPYQKVYDLAFYPTPHHYSLMLRFKCCVNTRILTAMGSISSLWCKVDTFQIHIFTCGHWGEMRQTIYTEQNFIFKSSPVSSYSKGTLAVKPRVLGWPPNRGIQSSNLPESQGILKDLDSVYETLAYLHYDWNTDL